MSLLSLYVDTSKAAGVELAAQGGAGLGESPVVPPPAWGVEAATQAHHAAVSALTAKGFTTTCPQKAGALESFHLLASTLSLE